MYVSAYYTIVKLLSWIILRVGFSLEVRGREHLPRSGPYILASNHVSFLDPVVVGVACSRRVTFLARSTLFEQPLLGWFMRGCGVIPLLRGETDFTALRAAARRLRAGAVIGLFPEGTRQLSGTLGAARRGVGVLAVAADVPIVPMLVQGTYQAMPPSGGLHRAKIRVAFGPQITYTKARFSPRGSETIEPERGHRSSRHEDLAEAVTHSWHQLQEALKEPTSHS